MPDTVLRVAALMTAPTMVAPDDAWRERYISHRVWGDFALVAGVGAATLAVAAFLPASLGPGADLKTYCVITVALVLTWGLVHRMFGVYDTKYVIEGSEEYRRVLRAVVAVFALVSIVAALAAFSLSRVYLVMFFGLAAVALVGSRKLARRQLAVKRASGLGAVSRVLVIGGTRSARQLARAFARHLEEGYRVVGVWWPDDAAHFGPWVDVLGQTLPSYDGTHTLADAVEGSGADAVIVSDTELLGNEGLKALGWALAGTGIDLLVSPNVIDVAGPRLHVRPVANLPLIHLDEPQYEGASKVEKVLLDRTLAILGLIVAAPVMLAIACLIKLGDRGPVFYRSTRIGVGGRPFQMLKFRSMVVGAEVGKEVLDPDTGGGPMFKMREDPRVTRVGRFLRRYSLDELPQILNVLRGDMSVVGPRPPLPEEVHSWEGGVERRLLVKQGMTGLWQVSGRSDLPWEDAVRLDLDYVENWSITRDLQIIWRTARAVLGSNGAY